MSTRTSLPQPGIMTAARDLARTMRAGLELRRFPKVPKLEGPVPPLPDTRPLLAPLARLSTCPPPARPGLPGRVLGLLRRVAKKLMLPWLDQQTRYNLAVIDYLAAVDASMRTMHAQLVQCISASTASGQAHNAYLEQILHRLEQQAGWRQELIHGSVALSGRSQATAAVSGRILEEVFVQTHLPPPPGHILDLSPSAADLSALGYQVEQKEASPAALSFASGTFDAVVCLAGDAPADGLPLPEAARVLKRDGRLLLSVAFNPASGLTALRDRLSKFHILEMAFAVRQRGEWVYSTNGAHAESIGGVALIAGQRR